MEERVPSYLARVKGDRHSWALALAGAGGGATALSSTAWAEDAPSEMGECSPLLPCDCIRARRLPNSE